MYFVITSLRRWEAVTGHHSLCVGTTGEVCDASCCIEICIMMARHNTSYNNKIIAHVCKLYQATECPFVILHYLPLIFRYIWQQGIVIYDLVLIKFIRINSMPLPFEFAQDYCF